MFTKNVGKTDKMIRIGAGTMLTLISFFFLEGILSIIGYAISIVLFATAYMSFCGLYTLFGINTCRLESKKKE